MQSSREIRHRPSFHRPLCLHLSFSPSLTFSLSRAKSFFLSLFQHFRTAWAGKVAALLAAIFARRKPLFQPRLSWIATPARENEWRRGDRQTPRQSCEKVRNVGKRIAPWRRFRRRRDRTVPPVGSLELWPRAVVDLARILNRLIDNGPIDH